MELELHDLHPLVREADALTSLANHTHPRGWPSSAPTTGSVVCQLPPPTSGMATTYGVASTGLTWASLT